jgi:dephospho-CoA kinase
MKVIGLTGGIGSGKSTVAQLFELLGVPVYNSDKRAKLIMETNPAIHNALVNRFGNNIYGPDGGLNRKLLSEIIFNHPNELIWVNSIVHPAVGADFDQWKSMQNASFVIKETALLIETLDRQPVDKIIVVTAPKHLRIARVTKRDQLSESAILKRMENQLDEKTQLKHADFSIDNDGRKSLLMQTLNVYKKLQQIYPV